MNNKIIPKIKIFTFFIFILLLTGCSISNNTSSNNDLNSDTNLEAEEIAPEDIGSEIENLVNDKNGNRVWLSGSIARNYTDSSNYNEFFNGFQSNITPYEILIQKNGLITSVYEDVEMSTIESYKDNIDQFIEDLENGEIEGAENKTDDSYNPSPFNIIHDTGRIIINTKAYYTDNLDLIDINTLEFYNNLETFKNSLEEGDYKYTQDNPYSCYFDSDINKTNLSLNGLFSAYSVPDFNNKELRNILGTYLVYIE